MDKQYLAFAVVVLAQVLPLLGVELNNEQLTQFVSVGATIVFALGGILAGWKKGQYTLGGRPR